jgi:hypothetical protein
MVTGAVHRLITQPTCKKVVTQRTHNGRCSLSVRASFVKQRFQGHTLPYACNSQHWPACSQATASTSDEQAILSGATLLDALCLALRLLLLYVHKHDTSAGI